MQSSYDVVIVGGGPAGSMAAWEAAKAGSSVCLLEKDRDSLRGKGMVQNPHYPLLQHMDF